MEPSQPEDQQEPVIIKADEVDTAGAGFVPGTSMDIADTGLERNERSAEPGQIADGITRREVPSPNILLPSRPSMKRNQSQPPPPQQPPPPPAPQGQQALNNQNDSLSLTQLKQIVTQFPRFERTAYAFVYKDTGTFPEEVDEWFLYNDEEHARLSHARATFESQWSKFNQDGPLKDQALPKWTSPTTSVSSRTKFLRRELGGMENPNVKLRSPGLESILYVILGVWAETAGDGPPKRPTDETSIDTNAETPQHRERGPESQLEWMMSGAELVYDAMGIQTVFDVLRSACLREWDDKSGPPELTPDHAEVMEFETQELTNVLTVMYFLVEAGRRQMEENKNSKIREELASLDPDYLLFLVRILTRLRWDDTTDLPLMKVLLLFWKSLLLLFGGAEELVATKAGTQEQPGTISASDAETRITASPLEYHAFRQEITSKYPAYKPPPPLIPLDLDNNSILPPLLTGSGRNQSNGLSAGLGPARANANGGSIIHQPVHIATPAPSPPPSPVGPGGKAGKKQNFQTNQNFPFLYPPLDGSSNSAGGKGTAGLQDVLVGRKWEGSDIPASIREAGELFAGRTRMTRSIKQLWDERENFLRYERGWGTNTDGADDEEVQQEQHESSEAIKERDRQKINDPSIERRLDVVDDFYRTALPHLQSLVIVLLKVLLQNVTAVITQLNNGSGPNGLGPGFQPQDQNAAGRGKAREPNGRQVNEFSHEHIEEGAGAATGSVEDLDDLRSREIVAKAVSGLLLLLLKWFKVSHILKYEYLTQLLLDSNYLPLVLKLFAHQDLDKVVDSKPDVTELRREAQAQSQRPNEQESSDDEACPPPVVKMRRNQSPAINEARGRTFSPSGGTDRPPEVDELGYPTSELPSEPITSFSWRNFFSSINFLRIMQKICKRKAHRNLLLVQYKSSTILKKSLKVPQPDLRLYTLKLFKNQVPYCGRKWRQSNMRVITAIYLHCRPELRDDWLAGSDVDADVEEALPLEQALRALAHWHNMKRYPEQMGADAGLLEEEQDFFLRELGRTDFGDGTSAADEGNEGAWEGHVHLEGW